MSLAALARPTFVTSFPVPREYQRIHDDLYNFLKLARDKTDVETTHRAYTMCQSVFQVFRRRLDVKDAIRFSCALPAGIPALFVAEWDKDCLGGRTKGTIFKSNQNDRSSIEVATDA